VIRCDICWYPYDPSTEHECIGYCVERNGRRVSYVPLAPIPRDDIPPDGQINP